MRLDEWLKYVEEVEKKRGDQTPIAASEEALKEKASASPTVATTLTSMEIEKEPAAAEASLPDPAVKLDTTPAKPIMQTTQPAASQEAGKPAPPVSETVKIERKEIVAEPSGSNGKTAKTLEELTLRIPEIEDFLPFLKEPRNGSGRIQETAAADPVSVQLEPPIQAKREVEPLVAPPSQKKVVARKTEASPATPLQDTEPEKPRAGEKLDKLPKHIQILAEMTASDEVAQNSYKRDFRETRGEMLSRLLDPPISLEEAARILNVCPTTVRRYTNKGVLPHFRTVGNQRRFRLSDVISFMESQRQRSSGKTQSGQDSASDPA